MEQQCNKYTTNEKEIKRYKSLNLQRHTTMSSLCKECVKKVIVIFFTF